MTLAALILPLALLAGAAPSQAQRFDQCVAAISADAAQAYEDAMAWAAEAQNVSAYRCAAMALIAQDRASEGARRFDSLGAAVNPAETALRAELFSQAGNAWLLAREPSRARSSFTRAITTIQSDRAQLPDLFIDRARAYAMERDWRHAEEDLSRALDIRAHMHQRSFELAEVDANTAAAIEPANVDNYLVLGHVRESKRLGAPVEEQ
jgi:tetratricopeptide (TPR) repeat protein